MWVRVDVYIRESEVIVEAETPGLARGDLLVRATDRTLRIQTDLGPPRREWRDYHRRERGRGGFDREIPLPAAVDPRHAEARLRDGVLEVCLPLRRDARSFGRLDGGEHLPVAERPALRAVRSLQPDSRRAPMDTFRDPA